MEKHLNMQKYKLIKTEVNYLLKTEEGIIIASTSLKKEGLALSLKNCQAIERGYDLDELALYAYKPETSINHSAMYKCLAIRFFKEGFQKALEILGDKKFSEEDMEDSFCEGKHRGIDDYNNRETRSLEYYDYINKKRTQQTEWDVEIVMGDPIGIGDKYTPDTKPKLDGNGCIILKKNKGIDYIK